MKYVEYRCECCEFITTNKKDHNRHCDTKKHTKKVINLQGSLNTSQAPKKPQKIYGVYDVKNEKNMFNIDANSILNIYK